VTAAVDYIAGSGPPNGDRGPGRVLGACGSSPA
jgi:hypothetical protein